MTEKIGVLNYTSDPRVAVRDRTVPPSHVVFSSSCQPYAEKTNTSAIHAVLNLPAQVRATGQCGSVHSVGAEQG